MDKQLSTKNTNIAVKQESIPVPEGKTENRELRSTNSKTFVHPEKINGKDVHTCEVRMGAVCYTSDDGELRSIDTTVRQIDDKVGIEWAPYKFYLHPTGIGFDFYSREGGECSVKLTGIGGEKFDSESALKPDITDNVIIFKDVRPGCDIVIKCFNERVKTVRILHDADAPRTFEWQYESDRPELIDSTLTGTDAAGNQLELSSEVDGDSIREAWLGTAIVPLMGDSANVVYPVEIDPTVTVNPAATADDGYEYSSAWNTSPIHFGVAGPLVNAGVRFPSVAIGSGVTVSSATFGMESTAIFGAGGAGTIYGRATANPGQFDSGADLPSAVSKTTASTAASTVGTTGLKTWDVSSIAQEVLNLSRTSGDAVALLVLGSGSGTGYTRFTDYGAGGNIPYLSITYTEAASGSIGPILENRLLLGRILGGSILC